MKISTGGRTNESEENASIPAEELCESTRLALADEKDSPTRKKLIKKNVISAGVFRTKRKFSNTILLLWTLHRLPKTASDLPIPSWKK